MSPRANLPNVNPLLAPNLILPVRTPSTQDTTSVRIDHRFSDKDLIFGRITRGRNDHHLNVTPHVAEQHRRLPACRDIKPALAEYDWSDYLGAHHFPHLDE